MSYQTIYETSLQNRLILIKSIFTQNDVDYRFLEQSTVTSEMVVVKVQVSEKDRSRAESLLRDYGFLRNPAAGLGAVSMARFWIWLVIALIMIIIASVLINTLR